MKCSIIIRSYNEEEHIGRLLTGIQAQDIEPHEVILVDSGSTDRTVDIAKQFGITIIPIRKEEFSFGRALNVGCKSATGDILVFASAHVYPLHDVWLKNLIAPFRNKQVVLSYGKQRGNHLNKFSENQIFRKWFPTESVCPQKTYFCNNANCAVRRDEWEKRPYDETLSGLEDLAWARAAQEAGRWIAYAADAEIVHVHDETWDRVRNRYQREAMAMKRINEHATFTLFDLLRLTTSNILSDYRVGVKKRILAKHATSILLFRFNQFWGTYRGYNNPCEITAELKDRFYFPVTDDDEAAELTEPEGKRIDYGMEGVKNSMVVSSL